MYGLKKENTCHVKYSALQVLVGCYLWAELRWLFESFHLKAKQCFLYCQTVPLNAFRIGNYCYNDSEISINWRREKIVPNLTTFPQPAQSCWMFEPITAAGRIIISYSSTSRHVHSRLFSPLLGSCPSHFNHFFYFTFQTVGILVLAKEMSSSCLKLLPFFFFSSSFPRPVKNSKGDKSNTSLLLLLLPTPLDF